MLRYFIEELKIDVNDREYNEQDNRDTGWSALEWAISGFTGDETLIKYLSGKGANFEYVKEINLKGKKLSKLPNFVFKCVNLEKLDCSINTLTSLSDSLGNLKKIKILHCFLNQLVSLPESLGELKNLSYLDHQPHH
jgi:Leucine-rich repeat (LRR) protein